MATIKLEIVTPEAKTYSEAVDMVTLTGTEGEMGILPHHAPLISLLGQGVLRLKTGDQEQEFAIFGGFVQVRPDKVVVMAESADLASEIDLEAANAARHEAERAIETGAHDASDLASARASLQRELIRIRVAERRHHEGTRHRG